MNAGLALAVSGEGQVTPLPHMGHFAHENTVVVPGFANRVVTFGMDDTNGASELYMYVAPNTNALLAGAGQLYVFTAEGASHAGNLSVGQQIPGRFEPVNPANATPAALQAAADNAGAHGAFPFVRLEDADYLKTRGNRSPSLYFVETGSPTTTGRHAGKVDATCNGVCDHYGSIYRLELNPSNPVENARLTLMARSRGVAAGDWASPDNVALSANSLMLQEDPAYPEFNRAPRIYQFHLNANGRLGAPAPVVQLTNDNCSDAASTCRESSGIINAFEWLGAGTWLFDVQAHTLPVPSLGLTGEGGQLLYLRLPGSGRRS